MDNPEKLATLDTKNTKKKRKRKKTTTQYVLDTTIHKPNRYAK